MPDVEKMVGDYSPLGNGNVSSFIWRGVSVTVKDRQTHEDKLILNNVTGTVRAGELMAIMGPSGSGKSTLLNVLANRVPTKGAHTQSEIFLNARSADAQMMRRISCYVEQEDTLVGSLTVKETLILAARLSLPKAVSAKDRISRVETLLIAFGLTGQSDTLVGTPIRKGISGGQKRRVSVAAQMITGPKILFLDEPTSGLDSASAFEVISFVRDVAKKHSLIVIASIHQPSTSIFAMFDQLLLLSHGNTAYSGPVKDVQSFFDHCGFPVPKQTNLAEFITDFVNTDFARTRPDVVNQVEVVINTWQRSSLHTQMMNSITTETSGGNISLHEINSTEDEGVGAPWLAIVTALIHRNFIKSYRDIIAYGIRIAMYLGLAIMMGTVWLRLDASQANLQAFTNAIFFGGAFMSFMAVAYIPAYLEDRATLMKERANGLYGPSSFIISNFLTGLPYLFVISLLFSIVVYWLSNFRPTAGAFWTWVMWLFLDLIAAESLVVLIASIVPIFVVALAATAFANGLWMCTMGFLVRPGDLNPFWRYVFHYIDYQSYVFEGMMVNEFADRVYSCPKVGDQYDCIYNTPLSRDGFVPGTALLDTYGYKTGRTGEYVGILLAIVFVYRALAWFVLYIRRN